MKEKEVNMENWVSGLDSAISWEDFKEVDFFPGHNVYGGAVDGVGGDAGGVCSDNLGGDGDHGDGGVGGDRERGANMGKWVNRPQEFGDLRGGYNICNKDE